MPLIEVRDGVRGGKRCFVGTGIAVYDVLEYLAGGMTTEQIVDDFPELSEAHVRARTRVRRASGASAGRDCVKLLFDETAPGISSTASPPTSQTVPT
jgi:uncharacterized protein (DUF433 family)